jgi:SAM-dependent methyltransferase
MRSGPRYLSRRDDIRDTSWWSQFGYHNRRMRELIRALVSQSGIHGGAKVLDYGCADAPYRSELPEGVSYVGTDIAGNTDADVTLARDGSIPIEDATIDLVLSTQVLEHVDDPALYLSECFRVLKPGGSLVLSTHGIIYYHPDPEDHWRWTRTGLTKILESAGFHIRSFRGVMGLVPAALQLIQDGTIAYLPAPLRRIYALLMQAAIAVSDRRYRQQSRVDSGLIIGTLAVKPEPTL